MAKAAPKPIRAALDRGDFQHLLDALKKKGYCVVGPTVRDGAIIYDELQTVSDLPEGWTSVQSPGQYELKARTDKSLFGYTGGPQSWKRFLHPPRATVWQGKRDGFSQVEPERDTTSYAFIGVRACELKAIALQDEIMTKGPFVEGGYAARRKRCFIVAVNCGEAGGTCFCASMNAGPKAEGDFDLCLTEITEGGKHRFLVESGSKKGEEVLKEIPHHEATASDEDAAEKLIAKATKNMGRKVEMDGVRELLQSATEHPRWEETAARCLTCANCTFVCPTCFCVTLEDTTDLQGKTATRTRRWDSCFTVDFSYIHGGSIRPSPKSRYRQWLTHKFATWQDQFGAPGCTGCGRCITWCPKGIDVTEEVAAIQGKAPKQEAADGNH